MNNYTTFRFFVKDFFVICPILICFYLRYFFNFFLALFFIVLSPTKTIVIDEFVEVINDAGKSEFAKVCSVEKYRQDNSPVPISSLTEFVRKIKVNEIKEFMYKHTHSYHEKIRITSLLSKNV